MPIALDDPAEHYGLLASCIALMEDKYRDAEVSDSQTSASNSVADLECAVVSCAERPNPVRIEEHATSPLCVPTMPPTSGYEGTKRPGSRVLLPLNLSSASAMPLAAGDGIEGVVLDSVPDHGPSAERREGRLLAPPAARMASCLRSALRDEALRISPHLPCHTRPLAQVPPRAKHLRSSTASQAAQMSIHAP